MSAEILLSKLDKVRRTGRDSWIACCPAHDDKHPSLTVRELEDDRVLVHCFGGCSTEEVLSSIGLTFDALYPQKQSHHGKPERRPFPAASALHAVGFESLVVVAAGAALLAGRPFTPTDRERLIVAVARIQAALSAAGVNSHA